MPFGIGGMILGGGRFRWNNRSGKNNNSFENDSSFEMTTTFLSFGFHSKKYAHVLARTDMESLGVSDPCVWVTIGELLGY
jgi:hypothetical protein